MPRESRTCISYRDGHHVHWIPVLRLVEHIEHVEAELTHDGLALILAVGDARAVVRNHDEARVRRILEEAGTRCRWYPSLRYASWPSATVTRWASLSLTELQPCMAEGRAEARPS